MFLIKIWRYVPRHEDRPSKFNYVTEFKSEEDKILDYDDFPIIYQVFNLDTGQIRVKNYNAPEEAVVKFVGYVLDLPSLTKTYSTPSYMVIHRSSFNHKKIEYDEFHSSKPLKDKEWYDIINTLESRFKYLKDNWKNESFKCENEYLAFSMGRRAWFLWQLVVNEKFIHIQRDTTVAYTQL